MANRGGFSRRTVRLTGSHQSQAHTSARLAAQAANSATLSVKCICRQAVCGVCAMARNIR
jgi:succinate dehydrogenase/fumarate reductase-like Fe-S protein